MKTLVVFYSRTGNTSVVASKLVALLRADTDRILPRQSYEGGLGALKAVFHSLTDRRIAIDAPKTAPGGYDLVVIGGPVWAGRIASPVKSYLRAFGGSINRIAFFVTAGAPSSRQAFSQMETLVGKPPAATLLVSAKDLARGDYDRLAREFVERLGRPDGKLHDRVA